MINKSELEISLEKVEGFVFESFIQDFLSSLDGANFVPLGGVKDGGTDGVYNNSKNEKAYIQITRQEDHRSKIRKTCARLIESGRNLKTLHYYTARFVANSDKEEDLLTDELDVIIRIRDKKYIISHINDNSGTIAAYNNHLKHYTDFLKNITRETDAKYSNHIKDPTAYVFLQHELTNRLNDRKLLHSLTDTLILWSLTDTDPDKGIFLNETDIASKIFSQFPWAKKIINGQIKSRLESLRNKTGTKREIRWYSKDKKYCLPHETRESIKNENINDEAIRIKFLDELKTLSCRQFDADDSIHTKIASLCCNVIHKIFEKQGLLFSHFIASSDEVSPPLVVSDCINDILELESFNDKESYKEHISNIIRSVFYDASETQREYLNHLSRTYILLFSLQAEPKIIEYFNSMSASFRLFLGSDILVKALSERYLKKEDQAARNLLKISTSAGISMLLSECVLEEVYTHIRGTYYEFKNYFEEMEPYITEEIARNSNKILIRAYFYAKKEGKVRGWKTFLDQFITYDNICNDKGINELKGYLTSEFNLKFVENAELESFANKELVRELTDSLLSDESKENESLAYNTSLLVHGIYGLRRKNNETSITSEFGFKTWWLTNQTKVLNHTVDLVKKQHSQYIMRPEFILNFIAMSPKCEDVRKSFNNIFPSHFGIQLGHRLKDDVFHKILFDYHRTSASFNNRAGIAGVSMQSFNNCVTMPSKSYLRLNL